MTTEEAKDWEKAGATLPVWDASAPERCGSRGQRLRFHTLLGLDEVYAGCRKAGLQVVGVRGTRVYGSVTKGYVLDKDGEKDLNKGVQVAETGTARMTKEIEGRRMRKPRVEWCGEPAIEGGYWVTVMAPRAA